MRRISTYAFPRRLAKIIYPYSNFAFQVPAQLPSRLPRLPPQDQPRHDLRPQGGGAAHRARRGGRGLLRRRGRVRDGPDGDGVDRRGKQEEARLAPAGAAVRKHA